MLSIIVPNYNKEKYLQKCIKSILQQSLTNYEVIIVDDASTDSSRTIINEYASRDSRIKPIYLKKNGGVSNARNVGIRASKGQYVTMLDSDDFYWGTKKLEAEMKIIEEHGGNCLAYSYRVLVDEEGKPLKIEKDENRYVSGENKLFHFLTEPKANEYVQRDYIVPKNVLVEVGMYDSEITFYEDYDLFIRLVSKLPIYYTGINGTAYRIVENGLAHQFKNKDGRQYRVPLEIRKQYFSLLNKRQKIITIFVNATQRFAVELKILRRKIYIRSNIDNKER